MTPGEARLNLVAALVDVFADVSVHPGVPDRFNAPALVVEPADPWITAPDAGLPANAGMFRFNVRVIAEQGTPSGAEGALDDLLAATIAALVASDAEWSIETVSAPGVVTIAEAPYLSADIVVSAPFRFS